MTKTTIKETVTEYDDDGKIIKVTETETQEETNDNRWQWGPYGAWCQANDSTNQRLDWLYSGVKS